MSWDVRLVDGCGELCGVPHFSGGGTYPLGGSDGAELNVTYNYGAKFNFGELNGHQAKDTIPMLEQVVDKLGSTPTSDYWEPTNGNVGRAALRLLTWAKLHPDAKWEVV